MRRALLSVAALGAMSCGARPAAQTTPPAPTPLVTWRYDVVASREARELAVDARIIAPRGEVLTVEGAGPFLRDVEIEQRGGFAKLEASRSPGGDLLYRVPPCGADGCRVRYRFALAEAADRMREVGCALDEGGAILTSPSAWLLHPVDPEVSQPFQLRVTTPPGTSFISGLLPTPPTADAPASVPPVAYQADVTDLPNPAWAAFGPLRVSRAQVGEGVIDVAVAPGEIEAGDAAVTAWVSDAAKAVRAYYRRAPIARVLVVVLPRPGRGIGFARTLGNGGATILANVGRETTAGDFAASWELIHELLHVSFPTLGREHAWLEEGMATYVEPLIRARRGALPAAEVFARFRERMPFGLPAEGDGGLDGTRSWGRTYWGGALFCLLADLEIRARTGGERSLDDALRGIVRAGGNVSQRWDMDQVIAVGDAATGVPVLRELYARMRASPESTDLGALWHRLGVIDRDGAVTFDDGAALAETRRALLMDR